MAASLTRGLLVAALFVASCWLAAPDANGQGGSAADSDERFDGLDDWTGCPIAVSGDGGRVIYVTPGVDNDWRNTNEVVRYDVATGASTRILTSHTAGCWSLPSLSSDGSRVALQYQRGARPTGPHETRAQFHFRELLLADVPADPTAELQRYDINILPPWEPFSRGDLTTAFSRDGSRLFLAFGNRGTNPNQAFGCQRIFHLRFGDPGSGRLKESRNYRKPTHLRKSDEFFPVVGGDVDMPVMFVLVQPSGDDPAVRAYRRSLDFDKPELDPLPVVDGGPIELPLHHVWWPTIAPSGKWVVAQYGGWNVWSIIAMSADSTQGADMLLRATREVSYAHPSMAPGGRWIAYEKHRIEMVEPPVVAAVVKSRQVCVYNVITGKEKVIAERACFPVFSPDGQRVFLFEDTSEEGSTAPQWTFKVVNLLGLISARDLGRLEPEERERLLVLVRMLGDDEYVVRRDATRQLKELGERAIPELRRLEATRDDPEVRLRLIEVIRFLETDRPVAPDEDPRRRYHRPPDDPDGDGDDGGDGDEDDGSDD